MEQPIPPSRVFRSIICPVEFSECGAAGLRYAAAIARCQTARITVLHGDRYSPPAYFTPSQIGMLVVQANHWRDGTQDILKEFVRSAVGAEPPDMAWCVVQKDPFEAILETADSIHADLIVMGTHGRCGVNRLLNGSIAEEVVRIARIPLLAVRTRLTQIEIPARRVLCAVNDSPEARCALDVATLISSCFRASLTVLHVAKHGKPDLIVDLRSWIPDSQRTRCQIAEVIREGDPVQEIVEAASESDCDLVIIGTAQHRRFPESVMLGTTTQQVMRHSSCPVMAVPLGSNKVIETA